MIGRMTIDVTTAGGAGVAAGNADSPEIRGEIVAVHLTYTSQPATTDVTLKMVNPDQTILNIVDANADGWFYPRVAVQDNAGAGVTYNGTQPIYSAYPVHGKLNLAVAGANDAGVVRAEILYRR